MPSVPPKVKRFLIPSKPAAAEEVERDAGQVDPAERLGEVRQGRRAVDRAVKRERRLPCSRPPRRTPCTRPTSERSSLCGLRKSGVLSCRVLLGGITRRAGEEDADAADHGKFSVRLILYKGIPPGKVAIPRACAVGNMPVT